ncbi:MAG TPA: phosphotransferase [Rhizomicrobium sp.]|nr:phosphotransferase [Rhizomicrobium sp.]
MAERSPKDFLHRSGWGDADVTPLPGDASTRRYARLTSGARRALLMDQPQGAESPQAAEHASEAERQAMGYNALARLAGSDTSRFQAVAEYLRGRGLAAPRIHAADHPSGFLILEDFGETLFADVLANGEPEEELYKEAVEVLAKLHAEPAPTHLAPGMPLFAYDEAALLAETDLLTEWFIPLALGRAATKAERAEHRALWRAALDTIADHGRVLVHRDFHAQNLMWMPERSGLARVGLIDFQDAVAGSRAYDLISLTEDARRDVSPALAERTIAHYLAAMKAQGTPLDENRFRAEMAVMAAQRNAKIVGIFARLYERDAKPRYLALLPRVWGNLERDLAHPALTGLRAWYDRTIPHGRRLPQAEKENH